MTSRLNWYCTGVGAEEKPEASLSEDGVLSLCFVGASVHVVMHTSNARTTSETYWMMEMLASRLVGLLTLPASCRGARCTLRHLATCLDTTMAMLMPRMYNDEPTLTDSRVADLSTCSFVLLLCTRVEPQSSGGVSQAILASCRGSCNVVYTDGVLRVHTDVLASTLDTDDESAGTKWRNSISVIACAPSGGAATVVLEAPQPPIQGLRAAGLLSASLTTVLARSSAGDDVPFPLLSRRSGDGSSSASSPRIGTPHLVSPRSTSPRSPATASPHAPSSRANSPRVASPRAHVTLDAGPALHAAALEGSSEDTDEESDDLGDALPSGASNSRKNSGVATNGDAGVSNGSGAGAGGGGGGSGAAGVGNHSGDHESSPSSNTGGRLSSRSRTSSRGSSRGSLRGPFTVGAVSDVVMAWLLEFNDWASVPLEVALATALWPVLERHKRGRLLKCVGIKVPAWGSGLALAASSAPRLPQRSVCPIGVMVAQHQSTVVLHVRTLQYDRLECFAQPSHVVLTVHIHNDAVSGDSHKTKWGAYQGLGVDELAPAYRRHVVLPCLIDPSTECIVVEDTGVVSITFALQCAAGSSLLRSSPAAGKSLRARKGRK